MKRIDRFEIQKRIRDFDHDLRIWMSDPEGGINISGSLFSIFLQNLENIKYDARLASPPINEGSRRILEDLEAKMILMGSNFPEPNTSGNVFIGFNNVLTSPNNNVAVGFQNKGVIP